MKRCKYIVIDKDYIYLFPMFTNHDDMYNAVKGLHRNRPCTGAGFVSFKVDCDGVTGECWGESLSLRIPSNPAVDNILLNQLIKDYE